MNPASIIQTVILLPLGVAVAYLGFARYPVHPYAGLLLLFILLLTPIILLASAFRIKKHARILRQLALLSPCVLAPLAVLTAWATTPGPGVGGFGYFLHWLTKHPNFGPINIEVLLGILCVLLSSLLPAVFAFYAITKTPRRWLLLLLVVLEIVFLSPVVIMLDCRLLLVGVTRFFGLMSFWDAALFMGPVLRMSAAGAMCIVATRIYQQETEH